MIRPLRELPKALDAARMSEPTLEAGLLHHREGVRVLSRDLPAFGPTVVHRALLAQLTHSASRIVSPTTEPLVDAAAGWTSCPCAEHAHALRGAVEDSPLAAQLPLVALFVDVAEGTRPVDPDVLSEGFDLAAPMCGTLLVVDAVIAELRAWVGANRRTTNRRDDRSEAFQAAAAAGDAEAVRVLLSSMGVTPSAYHQLAAEDQRRAAGRPSHGCASATRRGRHRPPRGGRARLVARPLTAERAARLGS